MNVQDDVKLNNATLYILCLIKCDLPTRPKMSLTSGKPATIDII